jgi:hypothetical protein
LWIREISREYLRKLNGEVEIKPMYEMEGKESYCV